MAQRSMTMVQCMKKQDVLLYKHSSYKHHIHLYIYCFNILYWTCSVKFHLCSRRWIPRAHAGTGCTQYSGQQFNESMSIQLLVSAKSTECIQSHSSVLLGQDVMDKIHDLTVSIISIKLRWSIRHLCMSMNQIPHVSNCWGFISKCPGF